MKNTRMFLAKLFDEGVYQSYFLMFVFFKYTYFKFGASGGHAHITEVSLSDTRDLDVHRGQQHRHRRQLQKHCPVKKTWNIITMCN